MNKYVAMMREQENHNIRLADYAIADATRKYGDNQAADWRAMREAWEAMEESLEEVMQFIPYEKSDIGTRPMWIVEIEAKATAALTKARAK